MNDVSNRAVREFSEFLNSIEADFPKPTCTTAYEITMKSTIVSALITLDTEKQMDERFWNHLRTRRCGRHHDKTYRSVKRWIRVNI